MSDEKTPKDDELSAQQTDEKLTRILQALGKERRTHWIEIASAVLLSFATVATAWCAYQSTLWGGVQTFRLAAAGKADRRARQLTSLATTFRTFDASMLIKYIEAVKEGNDKFADFLYRRFRPDMKKAVDAWLKTDPFNNPDAPPSPFVMPEYVQKELAEADHQDELAEEKLDEAQMANEISDKYVLLTVMFASVLFFGGIAGTVDSRMLRTLLFIIALVAFLVTASILGTMPISRE